MKDVPRHMLIMNRPTIDLHEGIRFCLESIFDDKEHYISDEIVKGLTFEELIGVLLLARDRAEMDDLTEFGD